MNSIVKIMSEMEMFIFSGAVDENAIRAAEDKLGVKFADEYKVYVSTFGTASYYRHELTGICEGDASINVVDVTLEERAFFQNIPQEWYVIEQTHVDGIVIWQDEKGTIYKATPQSTIKIYDSLKEYISVE